MQSNVIELQLVYQLKLLRILICLSATYHYYSISASISTVVL